MAATTTKQVLPTLVTVDVFSALFQSEGANTRQARAVRAEHMQPFVNWAKKQGFTRLSVADWRETLRLFSQLPA